MFEALIIFLVFILGALYLYKRKLKKKKKLEDEKRPSDDIYPLF